MALSNRETSPRRFTPSLERLSSALGRIGFTGGRNNSSANERRRGSQASNTDTDLHQGIEPPRLSSFLRSRQGDPNSSDQSNFDSNTPRPKEEDTTATYEWLERRTLTPEDVATTEATYADVSAVQTYSDIEWGSPTISAVQRNIIDRLGPIINQLPENAKVAVAGCGTFRDLVTVALLNKGIKVTGFDRSLAMLQVGIEMLGFSDEDPTLKLESPALRQIMELNGEALTETMKWAHFLNLVQALVDEKFNEVWIVQGLSDLQLAAERLSSGSTQPQDLFRAIMENTDFQEVVMEGVRNRVALTVADVQDQKLVDQIVAIDPEQRKFNFVMASSVLTHVPKEYLYPTLDNLTNLLSDDSEATLYLDLRIDAQDCYYEEGDGRVFRDNLLGSDRYFETLRFREVGLVEKYLAHQGFEVTSSWKSAHPDEQKPGSIHMIIKRRRLKSGA